VFLIQSVSQRKIERDREREREEKEGEIERAREKRRERGRERERERERERDVEYGCFIFNFKRNDFWCLGTFKLSSLRLVGRQEPTLEWSTRKVANNETLVTLGLYYKFFMVVINSIS
jgi:hypothetical protein